MSSGLLLDCDQAVAEWAFFHHKLFPMKVDRAFGIISSNKEIVGAALFSSYNSINAELSYYGKKSVTRGIVRALAKIALYELRLERCTVIVPKRPSFLLKKLPKFGFRFEGVQHKYYGRSNASRHTACRFVLFREDLERLAAEPSRVAA